MNAFTRLVNYANSLHHPGYAANLLNEFLYLRFDAATLRGHITFYTDLSGDILLPYDTAIELERDHTLQYFIPVEVTGGVTLSPFPPESVDQLLLGCRVRRT